jgi:ubiquinone/menaquinone biosynthesis C-methylase UbiE
MTASYDETYFEKLYQVEDRHFWFRMRQAIIATLSRDLVSNLPAGYRVMEIGCGTGHLLKTLEKTCEKGQVIGLDLYWEGLVFARQRTGACLIQGRAESMPFAEGQFDLVGMFDVLEHLENDEEILKSVHQILKKGGKLMLTVPAERQLWSTTDLIARHQRRYELANLKEKLEHSGFKIDYMSEFMQALHPLAKLRRKAPILLETMSEKEDRISRKSFNQQLSIMPILNELAYRILSSEVKQIQKRKKIKRGTSIIAIASRSE